MLKIGAWEEKFLIVVNMNKNLIWVDFVYYLCDKKSILDLGDANYIISREIDQLIKSQDYNTIDSIFCNLDFEKLHRDIITSFLAATILVKDNLPNRITVLLKLEKILMGLDNQELARKIISALS